MATGDILRTYGTQIRFGSSPSPTTANNLVIGTPTEVAITLNGTVTDTSARQSAKTATLGATRPILYEVLATIEWGTAPTAGQTVDFYWAPSPSATAGQGNCGGVSGSDAAYTGVGSSIANGVRQMQYIGSLVCGGTALIQTGFVGIFSPAGIAGSLVVWNNSGQTLFTTDNNEHHIVFNPILEQIQS